MTSEVEQTLSVCRSQIIVLNIFRLGSIPPSLGQKKKKKDSLAWPGPSLTNILLLASSPLLKQCKSCIWIINHPSLSVVESLEALLGLWHFVRWGSKKLLLRGTIANLSHVLILQMQFSWCEASCSCSTLQQITHFTRCCLGTDVLL